MEDPIFITSLWAAGLLPGDMKAEIKSLALSISAKKADYFIDHVILPGASVDHANLTKLLQVMENSDSNPMKQLASDITHAISFPI